MIFFATHLGPKGSVPPDRVLAVLCVFVTLVFVLRLALGGLWPQVSAETKP